MLATPSARRGHDAQLRASIKLNLKKSIYNYVNLDLSSHMAQPAANGADQLLKKIKELLDIQETNFTTKLVAETHALKIQVDALRQEVVVLQSIASEKKKDAPKTAAAKTEVAADAATTTEEVVKKPPFASNIPAYFGQLYKDTSDVGVAFKAKYLNEAMLTAMRADPEIAKKKNADVKANAEARFCHNYLKTNNKALADTFATEYKTAKTNHEAAAKPTQQVAEPTTPRDGANDVL